MGKTASYSVTPDTMAALLQAMAVTAVDASVVFGVAAAEATLPSLNISSAPSHE